MSNGTCTTIQTLLHKKTVLMVQCLSLPSAVGLSVAAESALLSLAAVTIVLALICHNFWRKSLFPPTGVAKQHLIRDPADLFMLSLFIADLIQALGGAMNVKWVHDEKVYRGTFCNAQGAIEQLGEATVALSTLVIAVHTFSSVWWRRGIRSLLTASIIIGIIWLFVILYVAIGLGLNINKSYMTPTYWCWIGPNYLKEKITGEYLWFWLTLGLSLVFYLLLFLWSTGNITVDEHKWWKFSIHRSQDSPEASGRRRHSLKLIAYPIVYSVVIIPSSVVRFIEFSQENKGQQDHVPPAWIFFAESIYRLSGILNVLLFILRRRGILLFDEDPATPNGQEPLSESSNASLNRGKVDEAQETGRLPSVDEPTSWQMEERNNHRT
jgi:hypothetical protein